MFEKWFSEPSVKKCNHNTLCPVELGHIKSLFGFGCVHKKNYTKEERHAEKVNKYNYILDKPCCQ